MSTSDDTLNLQMSDILLSEQTDSSGNIGIVHISLFAHIVTVSQRIHKVPISWIITFISDSNQTEIDRISVISIQLTIGNSFYHPNDIVTAPALIQSNVICSLAASLVPNPHSILRHDVRRLWI